MAKIIVFEANSLEVSTKSAIFAVPQNAFWPF